LTVASVAEVSRTESTFTFTAPLSGLDPMALIAVVNCGPFCSSWTRRVFDVEPLKNVFQSVVISATADAEPVPPVAEAEAAGVAEADLAVETAGDEELELLEEQADMAVAANMRPSTGIARPERVIS
jgi:hypothetical protein